MKLGFVGVSHKEVQKMIVSLRGDTLVERVAPRRALDFKPEFLKRKKREAGIAFLDLSKKINNFLLTGAYVPKITLPKIVRPYCATTQPYALPERKISGMNKVCYLSLGGKNAPCVYAGSRVPYNVDNPEGPTFQLCSASCL